MIMPVTMMMTIRIIIMKNYLTKLHSLTKLPERKIHLQSTYPKQFLDVPTEKVIGMGEITPLIFNPLTHSVEHKMSQMLPLDSYSSSTRLKRTEDANFHKLVYDLLAITN